MNDVRISIVVPNFNHANYLPVCLDSIVCQKIPPYEVLLADDGSTDNSLSVAQNYKYKIHNFKFLLRKINVGVNKNLNDALIQTNGTHVVFVAADDCILPDFIAEAYIMLKQYPNAAFWSSGSWIIIENNDKRLYPLEMNYPVKRSCFISAKQVKDKLYKYDSWFAGNTIIHNKQHFLNEGGFDQSLKSFSDGLLYRVMAAKYGCCFTPKRLGVWRIRQESHSSVCSKEISTMETITRLTMQKLYKQYTDIFSAKYKRRMHQRMTFAIVKLIWLEECKLNSNMKYFIKDSNLNVLPYILVCFFLKFIGYMPLGKRFLGQILLLLNYKPFDFKNILLAKLRRYLYVFWYRGRDSNSQSVSTNGF